MKEKDLPVPFIRDPFPTIEVITTHGKKVLPQDYEGRWFILFSHPGDFTPVCTTEFVSFALHNKEFENLNCDLIGLSIDTVFAHMKWKEWIKERLGVDIPFPIIADELGTVSKRLGMLMGDAKHTVRSVYIVDPKGIIRLRMTYPDEVGRNTAEILRALHALQTADANKVAMPANWPKNEIIQDKVILSPPSNIMEAQKRIDQAKTSNLDCFDWWFCYKSL